MEIPIGDRFLQAVWHIDLPVPNSTFHSILALVGRFEEGIILCIFLDGKATNSRLSSQVSDLQLITCLHA